MQFSLTSSGYPDRSGIFTWDSGLVRDGCFYAGYLAASTEEAILEPAHDAQSPERDDRNISPSPVTADEGVMVCLAVLSSKRWLFSKSDEREETIRMIWEARKAKRHGQGVRYSDLSYDATYPHASAHPSSRMHDGYQAPSHSVLGTSAPHLDRPNLPMLDVLAYQRRSESMTNTADGYGSHGWTSYTPPPTGNSAATSSGTGIRGSPEFPNVLPTFRPQSDDSYYPASGELVNEHFAYNVPVASSSAIPAGMEAFSHRDASAGVDHHVLAHGQDSSNYTLSSSAHFVSSSSMLHVPSNDYTAFGDAGGAGYH
jgi:hypothetical protein